MNWQLLIIIVYFALTMAIGILASRKTKSSDSFVGSGMGVFAIVCVACGQWLGGTATTGCSEYGFTAGISGWWYTIANGVGMLMMGLFFAEKYRKYGEVTIPGIIEKVVGPRSRTVCSILLIFVMLAVGLSQMIAAGKLGQSLLGLNFTASCCIFAVIFIVYTMSGGMDSVEATNKLHIGFMYFGMILAVVLALREMGGFGSFKSTMDAIDAAEGTRHFSMFGVGASKVTSWIVASVLSAGAAQASIQPVLAAKDPKTAKKACLIAAFVVIPFGFFTCMLGMAPRAMSDTGLLMSYYPNTVKLKILNGEIDVNMGGIYENIVAQELIAHSYPLYYYNGKKIGEVDFLLEYNGNLLPLEVKSGKDYKKHPALSALWGIENYDISKAFVLCEGNVKNEDRITYLPLYMAMCIREAPIDNPIIPFDLTGLN